MASNGVNLNLNFRSDTSPEQLLKELILSPLIYIRLLGMLCSIIVFGCIADQLQGNGYCAYNGSNACSFGVAIGVIGFLLCLAFLVKDVLYVVIDYSNNIVVKKVIVIVDAITNGFWGFMWFVAFVFAADEWRRTDNKNLFSTSMVNCANSGLAFSFFCIFIWAAIVGVNIFLFVRILKGGESYRGKSGGYASFPEDEGGASDDAGAGGGEQQYSPPEY